MIEIVEDSIGDQLCRDEHSRYTRAGMSTGSREIEVVISIVSVAGAQVTHLPDRVSEPVGRPVDEMEAVAPSRGCDAMLEFDMSFKVMDAKPGHAGEQRRTGT